MTAQGCQFVECVVAVGAAPSDLQKTVRQSASATVFAAISLLLEGVGGRYFNDNTETILTDHRVDDDPGEAGRRDGAPESATPRSARLSLGVGQCAKPV